MKLKPLRSFEEVLIGQKKYNVSGVSSGPSPTARSTFTIIRPPERLRNFSDDPSEPILHVGQPFMQQFYDARI